MDTRVFNGAHAKLNCNSINTSSRRTILDILEPKDKNKCGCTISNIIVDIRTQHVISTSSQMHQQTLSNKTSNNQ